MEKFINECYVMIETMENCASGWVELEQEIINSIDSFSDRIIYTESLIMEEATLILDMADRIVETEAIMIDLIESCNCSEKQQIKQINKKSKLLINSTSNIIHVGQSTMSTPLRPVTVVENSTLSNDCAAMDYAIEVMDACIQTFEVYNDDFLEVLSYMNSAIQDMGDRIVMTECLIVNMSYQIGYMADRIVEVEYLMADMAKSCCRGGNQNPLALPEITPLKTINLKYGDDDEILKYCTFNETTSQKNVSQFISISKELLINALQKLHFSLSNGKIGQIRSARSGKALALTKDGDVMPCESIWNPFCCAAEICADMMVEMIELMANGADWMTEMCIAMIDEIGYLADDILKTEENIILMGYNIGYMADCIVVFIDQGLEFMTLFCPAENQYYSWRGHFTLRSSYTSESEGCSSDGQNILRLRDAIQAYSPHSIILKISSTIGEKWAARQQYRNQVLSWKKNLQSNPFGEFAQMVDVMMEAMTTFMKTMDKQTEMINQMMNTLTTFAQEESKMSLMVIEMAADVEQLENEVNTQEDLMVELTNCKN